jgi:HemY protein
MIRFLWLGFRLFVLMIAAVWLSDHPGKVAIHWQGYLLETSVGALVVIVLVTLGAFIIGGRIFRDLMRIPERWARHKELQTGRKGRKALTSGLAAVASGDAVVAKKMALQTEATIVDPVLSHLLNAEALILSGETDAAETQFELLLGRDDTRVIGHRGLIEVALARGDWMRAYSRARQARPVMPKSPWLMSLLVDLAVRAGDLDEARQALDQAVRGKLITGNDATRRQASLLTALAYKAQRDGDAKQAQSLAEKALEHDAGFVPAAVLAARLLHATERAKSAERVIEKAWSLSAHPELVQVWHDIAPDTTMRARWMERLKTLQPNSTDAALAYAAAAIEARLWNDARRELEALLATPAAARAYALLARVEREEKGNLTTAVTWYDKAIALPIADTRWICHACGHTSASWGEICTVCGAFGQIQTPEKEKTEPATRIYHASLPGIGTPIGA